jgi:FeS assembly protein IscX
MNQGRLFWDASFEIVLALIETYPDVEIDTVGIEQLREWIIALPDFVDDPEIVTQDILHDILREWYEETNPI